MTEQELTELDVAVAEKVMGWKVFRLEQKLHDGNTPRPHCLRSLTPLGHEHLMVFDAEGNLPWWSPARRMDDAWKLVEKMIAMGHSVLIEDWAEKKWWVCLVTFADGHDSGTIIGETAQVAICNAILKVSATS